MQTNDIANAILLGILEGCTEFLPISSTGHLVLLSEVLGFKGGSSDVFKIVIQLGAILAILWCYRTRFTDIALHFYQPQQSRFVLNLFLAFLPSAIAGLLFYKYLKSFLSEPLIVATMLIIGGIVIILVEKFYRPIPKHNEVDNFTPILSFKIGLCQMLSLIPGTSRSGSTIIGALLLGVGRKAATEFSFFLAVPTMLAATLYDLYKNWDILSFNDFGIIAIGFFCAFISAVLVVRVVVKFIETHGFTIFGYYRIVLGSIVLIALL